MDTCLLKISLQKFHSVKSICYLSVIHIISNHFHAFVAELGDYDESLHTENYVSEFRFVPNQVTHFEFLKNSELNLHRNCRVPNEFDLIKA